MSPLRLFSDRAYLPAGMEHITMLYPFWGQGPEDPDDPNSGRFDRYTDMGRQFFELAPLAEADLAVIPFDWSQAIHVAAARDLAMQMAEDARRLGKQTIAFFCSDSIEALPVPEITVFRTSLCRSTRNACEYAVPAWSEDFSQYSHGAIQPRQKRARPVVGFCGYAMPLQPSPMDALKAIARRGLALAGVKGKMASAPYNPGAMIRTMSMRKLSASPLVETNLIIKKQFWGGAHAEDGNKGALRSARLEYVQNMVESDYVLCARGAGNFSYRLYETLSCGRIPVFVDTDCVLPYDFAIDWKRYCVWIDEHNLSMIAEKVAEFHSRLSGQDFVDLQRECRGLWERWLSPEGYFSNFYRHFQEP